MPNRVSTKRMLMARQMSLDGKGNREIAKELGFTETLCRIGGNLKSGKNLRQSSLSL